MGTTFFLACFHSLRSKKLSLLSLICISLLSIFATSGRVLAEATPGGNISNPVVRAVDLAKPAVVRIITTLGGRLTVQFTDTQSATFPLDGGYYDLKLSGSGTFVSSHGDILTADHVIQPPRDKSMDDVLQMTAAQDVANYINQNFHPQTPYSEQDAYSNMAFGIFRTQSTYKNPKSEVFLSKDYAGVINADQLSTVPAEFHAQVDKIEQESAVDQRDVAIIHVNMEDTPAVQLGDPSNVSQQDELTIIGFPGNGDLGDPTKPDPTTYLTSSVNKIYVSSIKEHVIQVGGNVEHGDSGGPALDSHGNIVGVVSFYNQDAQTPIGTSFLQTSSSAKELLTNLKIDTKPGKFQTAWEQAFNHYTSTGTGHWHQAYSDFLKLQKDYPNFQAVNPFLDYASQQSSHERLPQSTQSNYMAPLIIAAIIFIVAVIALALLAWFFLARRRNKPQPAYPFSTQAPQNFSPPYEYHPVNQTGYSGVDSRPQPYSAPQSIAATDNTMREFDKQDSPQTPLPTRFDTPPTPQPVESQPWPSAAPVAVPATPVVPNEDSNLSHSNPPWGSPMAVEPTQRQPQNDSDNKIKVKRIETDSTLEEKLKDWPSDMSNRYAPSTYVPDTVEQVPFPLDNPQEGLDFQQELPGKHESTQKLPKIPKPSKEQSAATASAVDRPPAYYHETPERR
ncbi:S1 family peptidase [Dictyobacter formicarum]|uniref:Peptidase S1 domain-containing protein n=1 Tax=Dictyobacter formicarum TaxID=2778368 RepID=A0ABQ3VV24_9CHLR|nr:serine protease [Dictyobacter formicarum]GHO89601.1 hypothetical protein KSZ_76070 [Dictyobacter formicarum]